MSEFNIAIVGVGNIGSGVVEQFQKFGKLINERCRRPVVLKTVCTIDFDLIKHLNLEGYNKVTDYKEVCADESIDVVVELIGGTTIARTVIETALKSGKHVVTANKAVLATYGGELFEIARENNVFLLFEAAVGAGIPFIRAMQGGLISNNFNGVYGILNGTCNYMLSAMEDQPGLEFDAILKEAMDKGYAEPDPTLDIEGDDTAHKIALMGSLAYQYDFRAADVTKEGITKITPKDFEFAKAKGQSIKLIASAEKLEDGRVNLAVWPTLVPESHQLAGIRGVINTCLLDCDPAGPMQFSGAGAGQGSTGSGIIGDICHLACIQDAESLLACNSLNIPKGKRPENTAPVPHPKRIARISSAQSKAAAEKLSLEIISSEGETTYVAVPEQSPAERDAMLQSLQEQGITSKQVCELRVAFQPDKCDLYNQ